MRYHDDAVGYLPRRVAVWLAPLLDSGSVREDAGENLYEGRLVPLEQTTVDATPAEEAAYSAPG